MCCLLSLAKRLSLTDRRKPAIYYNLINRGIAAFETKIHTICGFVTSESACLLRGCEPRELGPTGVNKAVTSRSRSTFWILYSKRKIKILEKQTTRLNEKNKEEADDDNHTLCVLPKAWTCGKIRSRRIQFVGVVNKSPDSGLVLQAIELRATFTT